MLIREEAEYTASELFNNDSYCRLLSPLTAVIADFEHFFPKSSHSQGLGIRLVVLV